MESSVHCYAHYLGSDSLSLTAAHSLAPQEQETIP